MKYFDKQAFVKSVVYRFFASSVTTAIAYFCTGKLIISISIGVLEFIGKIFTYYIFETIWKKFLKIIDAQSYRRKCYKLNKSGKLILISGLNCSGKTTLAKELMKHIDKCILLDGDAMRTAINYDLGFTEHDIRTNLDKVSNLANVLLDQGNNVIISCIAKNKCDREFIKQKVDAKSYVEVYVNCAQDVLEQRQKELHPETKVIQKDYERSDYDVIEVDSSKMSVDECAKKVIESI